jgi:hypothetical protein
MTTIPMSCRWSTAVAVTGATQVVLLGGSQSGNVTVEFTGPSPSSNQAAIANTRDIGDVVEITNTDTAAMLYAVLGTSATTADANGYPIPPMQSRRLLRNMENHTHVALFGTAAKTASVAVGFAIQRTA